MVFWGRVEQVMRAVFLVILFTVLVVAVTGAESVSDNELATGLEEDGSAQIMAADYCGETRTNLKMKYKGRWHVFEGGADADVADWYLQDAETGEGSPAKLTVEHGDYAMLYQYLLPSVNHSGYEDVSVNITIEDEQRTVIPYDRPYNSPGEVVVIHKFSNAGETDQEKTIHFSLSECVQGSASIVVRPPCEGGTSWDGEQCRQNYNVVAIPFFMEPEDFDGFYEDVERGIDLFADISPLRELQHPRQGINMEYIEPDEIDDPLNRKCFFTLSLDSTSINAYAQRIATDTYGDQVDTVIAVSKEGVELPDVMAPFSGPISGCAFSGAAVIAEPQSVRRYQPELTMVHEMGHTFRLCHNKGISEAGQCNLEKLPYQPRVGSVMTRNPVKSIVLNYIERFIDYDLTFTDRCLNDFESDGPGAIMNYCRDPVLENNQFSAEEYSVLRSVFQKRGWIQDDRPE